MPVTLRQEALHIKDGNTGEYKDASILVSNLPEAASQIEANAKAAIQTEGTAQVAAVTAEGTTQVTAVQDKGAEVLASIPADYSALTQDVSALQDQVTLLKPEKTVTSETASDKHVLDITGINAVSDLIKLEIEIASETEVDSYSVNCYGVNRLPSGTDTLKGYVAKSYLASNGEIVSSNDWYITEYFEVDPETTYRFYHGSYSNTFHLCFYDANYNYLTQRGYDNKAVHDITIASNAKYCRMSLKYSGINTWYVRKIQLNNLSLPVPVTSANLDAVTGKLTVSGNVYDVTPPTLFVEDNYMLIATGATNGITATYYTDISEIVQKFNKIPEIETDVANIKQKFFEDSQYFRNVRWGASAFNSYYHSADDGTSLFPSTTTALQYFTMFNTLVADYSGYADSHEMGLASDGTTMMYYYTFNPKTNQDGTNYKRPKIIIGAGQHGFEKTANFGLYWFVKNLLEDWESNDFLAYIRNHVQLIIMPMLNPYGFDHDTYTNANGVNLNRNWGTTAWSKGTAGTTTYGGEAPFDQVETQYARDVILANLDALWLCDYHNNGQTAPSSPKGYLWHSFALVTYNDAYFTKAIDAAKWHIDEITGHLYKDYPTICEYVVSGQFTDNNAPSHQGLMTAYAREHGIMAATMEGGAAFIGSGSRYSSPIHHMNADLIGNWIRCLLGTYSRLVY